ncbi:Glyoxylate/hydroxypyruvate reductase A [Gossypium arboreum]|uniref:Glyoxylate/hydroxypyruvate reductase A n=1 Tax=Gossypium arboreum TaxID=29729 RepID=A0A0B0PNV4_GOSAR|nr:Glyoxylate/hydroxypyruvate reductase A [Gossypium arboreum]
MSRTWRRNKNSYKTISGIWHRCEIPCKTCLGHGIGILLCMVIPSAPSIPSGLTGSPRIYQRNDEGMTTMIFENEISQVIIAKLARESKCVGGTFTLSIGLFRYS